MEEITKDTTIFEAIKINPSCAQVLSSVGMHCLGCAMSRGETVEEAAKVHGVDVDELVKRMNEAE
jgi:hybrid cluster-associated redox disulfide protein